jgi:hypothetical protein
VSRGEAEGTNKYRQQTDREHSNGSPKLAPPRGKAEGTNKHHQQSSREKSDGSPKPTRPRCG